MKKINSTVVLLLICLIISWNLSIFAVEGPCEEDDDDKKRVLFISSYSPSFPTFFGQLDGLSEVFDDKCVYMDVEFMDSKRFYNEENYEKFYSLLKYKVENLDKYDLIIAGDDNALEFVMNKVELFPDQPIIFMGVNNNDMAYNYLSSHRVSGVIEEVSFKGTIEIAKILKPNANKIVGIFDGTVTGQGEKKQFYNITDDYESFSFEDIDISNMTYDDFKKEVRLLDDKYIIIYGSALKDSEEKVLTYAESASLILRETDQPIFCLHEFGLDYGFVGGEVISFFRRGVSTAELAWKILNNEKVESEILLNDYIKIMDYDLIEKYNFNEKIIPKDIILLNKDENILKLMLPYIFMVFFVVLAETILIIYLRNNRKKRKKAEIQLEKSNLDLIKVNEKVVSKNLELTESNVRIKLAFEQIEEQKQKIYELIYIDGLTKVKNRLAITEKIKEWLNIYDKSNDNRYAILFIDIDNFKYVNDTFGHAFGDKIIIETANRLISIENDDVQIGRFGGDEFLVIIRYINQDDVADYINKIERLFSKSISIENISLYLTISIGTSLFPIHGITCEELIKKADMALYEAKDTGKNRAVVYNQKMVESLEDKVSFQSAIRKGFSNNEFYLNYQPYYDLNKDIFIGAEALIRWNSPDLGMVSPLKLIEASEEMGLIVEIGEWVLEESFNFAKMINDLSGRKIMISVNISPIQLVHPNFIEFIRNLIEKTGVDTSYIYLEMTESTLFEFWGENEHILNILNEMGLCIALDDFGTGFSSLSYFRDITASVLKIDKSFINNIESDKFDRYTIELIINLAHSKDLFVVAEGVENEEQVAILRNLNCDIIQGYYYAKPSSKSETGKLLLDNN